MRKADCWSVGRWTVAAQMIIPPTLQIVCVADMERIITFLGAMSSGYFGLLAP